MREKEKTEGKNDGREARRWLFVVLLSELQKLGPGYF